MDVAGKSSDRERLTRAYRSPRRQEQAQRTRQQILASARIEFLASGYAGTTMGAVADRAGVSAATVEKIFGTKPWLLKQVIDVAIVGDDQPLPVLARSAATRAEAADSIDEFLFLVSVMLAEGQQRSARLVLVVLEAAAAVPTLRPLAQQRLDQRHSVAEWILDGILRRAPIRPDADRAYAIDIVWLLMEPALFCRLTDDRGWSSEQYRRWLADSIKRLLVHETAG